MSVFKIHRAIVHREDLQILRQISDDLISLEVPIREYVKDASHWSAEFPSEAVELFRQSGLDAFSPWDDILAIYETQAAFQDYVGVATSAWFTIPTCNIPQIPRDLLRHMEIGEELPLTAPRWKSDMWTAGAAAVGVVAGHFLTRLF